ncbi:MAG: DUF1385 domain-containing protein [Candidatus Krumholzibacteria bacterium]|jgi:uncharacterized protein YqhQ|nr:DUF1385 domain-containing protein [Candidatus Krumholzibacteria bacterium]
MNERTSPAAMTPADADRNTSTAAAGSDEARKLDLAVGGQAVIEGVMMRSPKAVAIAVRNPEGRIVIRKKPFRSVVAKYRWLNIPVLRGGVHLLETMALGIDALMFSADQAVSEDRVERAHSSRKDTLWMWGTIVLAFALSLGLFFYLPLLVTHWLGVEGSLWFNVVDGIIRVALFILYLWAISLMKDMSRVFEYHGAEHKSIHAFENGRSLDAPGARPFTTLHPRCGTSFLFFVMIISIVVFVFLGKPETVGERLLRLAFVPLIGGLAYEAIKLSGRFCNAWWLRPVILPGLWLQRITTNEPDDRQLDVAMAALRAALTPEAEGFKTRIYFDLPEGDAPAAEASGGPRGGSA